MNDLHEKLSEFRGRLDYNTSLDIPDVEPILSKDDPDCVYAALADHSPSLIFICPPWFLCNVSAPFMIITIDSSTKLREPLCSHMEMINLSIP